jgi:hypothetical protein
MPDLPSIDEAFDEAVALTSEDSLAEEPEIKEEAPNEESETKPTEEVEEEAEDKAESEEEESFADKPDLSKLTPEQMEETYKNWQKAYTQKRQAEKQALKEMEARLEELKTQIPQQEKHPSQMTPQELQEWTLAQARKQVETERDNAYIESQEKSFYELDPRLDEDSPDYDEALFFSTVGKLTKERENFEKESGSIYGFDFVGKAKGLIKAYDESVKLKVQSYLKKNNETARNKVERSSRINPKTNAGKLKKVGGLELDDAFEEALTEVKGQFNW